MSEYFFPKLETVEAVAPYRLRTTWSTGEVPPVDVITHPAQDPGTRAHPGCRGVCAHAEWGGGIEWFDTRIWRGQRLRMGQEQAGEVSHEMFGDWMHRNDLSLTTAAEALGISRRMVSYYRTAHKAIPRSIWLACLGWEATRPKAKTLPRTLPTAREYAAAHT